MELKLRLTSWIEDALKEKEKPFQNSNMIEDSSETIHVLTKAKSVIDRWNKSGISPEMIVQNPDILANGFNDISGTMGMFNDLLADIKKAPEKDKLTKVFVLANEVAFLEIELGQSLVKKHITFDENLLAVEAKKEALYEPKSIIRKKTHSGTIAGEKRKKPIKTEFTPEILARRADILEMYLRETPGIRDTALYYRQKMHLASDMLARIEVAKELIAEIAEIKSARNNEDDFTVNR